MEFVIAMGFVFTCLIISALIFIVLAVRKANRKQRQFIKALNESLSHSQSEKINCPETCL